MILYLCSNFCGLLALAMNVNVKLQGTIQNSFKNIIEEHHNKNTMIKMFGLLICSIGRFAGLCAHVCVGTRLMRPD